MTKRKIIQITNSNDRLFALCDDGTVWEFNHDGRWGMVPKLPGQV
jgi:hypothetical protein